MNCSHFSIHYISMGHMLIAHLLLLPQRADSKAKPKWVFYNAKHIRRPEGRRRCCLRLPGRTWLGRLRSRPWEMAHSDAAGASAKGEPGKRPVPALSLSPSLTSRASGVRRHGPWRHGAPFSVTWGCPEVF